MAAGAFFRPFSPSVRAQGDTLGLQHCPDAAWVGQRLMLGLWGFTPGNFLNGLKSFFITLWIGTWRHSFNLRGELTWPTPPSLTGRAKRRQNKFCSGGDALWWRGSQVLCAGAREKKQIRSEQMEINHNRTWFNISAMLDSAAVPCEVLSSELQNVWSAVVFGSVKQCNRLWNYWGL